MNDRSDQTVSAREFDARITEIQRAVDLARDTAGDLVSLRAYTERIFAENQRATEMAERERAKAAAALTVERYNAAETAEREREKSAQALRGGLDRAITEGDERLREHIANQVSQIQAALDSADKLEVRRFASSKDDVEALRRELLLIQGAQKEAVTKAEDAQNKVNVSQNEFRSQLSEQAAMLMPRKEVESTVTEIRKSAETALPRETFEAAIREITASLGLAKDERQKALPREVFDRTLEEWAAWRRRVDETMASQTSALEVRQEVKDKADVKLTGWQLALAGFAVTIILAVVVIVVNLAAAG